MNKRIGWLLFLLCLTGKPLFSQEKEFTRQEKLRGSITPERAWWDLLHYELSLQVLPEDRSISGTNRVTFRTLKPGNKLQIDLQKPLEISKIVHSGKELKFERDENVHWVYFPKTLASGVREQIGNFNPAFAVSGKSAL